MVSALRAPSCLSACLVAPLVLAAVSRSAAAVPARIPVDEAKSVAAGIRQLPPAKRLVLYTDLPSSREVDELPAVFDQAFLQWCEYFGVDPATHAGWQMTGFLMKDKAKFTRAGLLPAFLPAFANGFAMNYNLWVHDTPTDYYRRHLLIHEGTHGFMLTVLGACGPPWYTEGLAELLGTHRWQQGRLTTNYMPANRDEVPDWGRVRSIKDLFAGRRAMRLRGIIDYPPEAHTLQPTDAYAWCWAAAVFLDRHPRYRERFRGLYKSVLEPDFNDRFLRLFQPDWRELNEEWQVFVAGMEYGYDVTRAAIDFSPGRALPASGARVRVAADQGWQNSGLRLEAATSYRLTASGRYQVGTQPKVWWCEPGGVSLRYYQGRPLGVLLAVVRPDQPAENAPSAFLSPIVIGLEATVMPKQTGTLYFKINHSAAELHDCAGELHVQLNAE